MPVGRPRRDNGGRPTWCAGAGPRSLLQPTVLAVERISSRAMLSCLWLGQARSAAMRLSRGTGMEDLFEETPWLIMRGRLLLQDDDAEEVSNAMLSEGVVGVSCCVCVATAAQVLTRFVPIGGVGCGSASGD